MAAVAAVAERCRRQKRFRILLLGLDGAGKTELCRAMLAHPGCSRRVHPWGRTRPDHHVLHHEFQLDACAFDLVDPCYPTHARGSAAAAVFGAVLTLWDGLLHSQPDAIIFLVDAADSVRLSEARSALHWMLRHPAVAKLPVLVLGNKVDKCAALEAFDLRRRLGLEGLCQEQRNALQGCDHPLSNLPLTLRQRIGSFHPDVAGSPPRPGATAVRMCSIARGWLADPTEVHAAIDWLRSQRLSPDAAVTTANAAPCKGPRRLSSRLRCTGCLGSAQMLLRSMPSTLTSGRRALLAPSCQTMA